MLGVGFEVEGLGLSASGFACAPLNYTWNSNGVHGLSGCGVRSYDEDALRSTMLPCIELKVVCLGGSEVWGLGSSVRDSG